jgi:hypothetical protein
LGGTISSTDKSAVVRELVWSATWDPEQQKTRISIDEINLERISLIVMSFHEERRFFLCVFLGKKTLLSMRLGKELFTSGSL